MENQAILSMLIPSELSKYFEVVDIAKSAESYTIYLEEKNIIPEEYSSEPLVSKGFYEAVTVKDFPLRGKPCYLNVKRRRWTHKETGKIVSRNWSLVAFGTRITQEFASFLKGNNR